MKKIWFVLIIAVLMLALYLNSGGVGRLVRGAPDGWTVICPPRDVYAMALDRDTVWAGGKEGLWKINRRTFQIVENFGKRANITYVRDLLVHDGALWVAHFGGLSIIREDGAVQTLKFGAGKTGGRVNSLLCDRQGRIWIGTWDGAVCLDNGKESRLSAADGLADNMVNVMMEHSGGSMWFGSYVAPNGGLSILDNGKWQVFCLTNGLPHNNVTAIVEAGDGTVWVGTGLFERGGAAQFEKTAQQGWRIRKKLTVSDGLAGEKVRSIFSGWADTLFLGSEYDGLTLMKDGRLQVLTVRDGLADPEIKCMRKDMDGNLWIGTRNGITMINAAAIGRLLQ